MNQVPSPPSYLPVAVVQYCERCKNAIIGHRYRLRIEAEPPQTKVIELSVCENCLESLGRWLERRGRDPYTAGPEGASGGKEREHSRRRRKHGHSHHEVALDRGIRSISTLVYLAAAGIVLTACGLIGLVVYLIVRS